ncbi:MAG: CRISPR-associated protein Csx19 [candidate division KSB1 bacterium]|nr:CRISPR-associated protein Csx19 [candidate division KSB1 bacterium]
MKKISDLVKPEDAPKANAEVRDWIAQKMKEIAQRVADTNGMTYLLAHADDGVIWGKFANGEFHTSDKVDPNRADPHKRISPELDGMTLQQAFLFNTACEIRLFRDELGNWQARKIDDNGIGENECIDELQILWGDYVNKKDDYPRNLQFDFTLVRDKRQQGLDHLLPIKITASDINKNHRARLRVRHFIEADENTGEARIALSRLVNLEIKDAAEA